MIYINPLDPNIVSAKETHIKSIKCYINKRVGNSKCSDTKCKICNSSLKQISNLNPKIKDFFSDQLNIELLIISSPADLEEINDFFWKSIFPAFDAKNWLMLFDKKNISKRSLSPNKSFSSILFDKYINQINKIIDYDWFCDKENKYYNAYDLANNLNRNTCTYCNRIYTSTVIDNKLKKIIRPTLDHWHPKSYFPLLALSFYNLIPSCTNCNSSVKGDTKFNLNDHIHPYVDINQTDEFIFKYKFNTSLDNYRIYLQDTGLFNSKTRKTLELMYINEMYNSHQSELRDLIKIKKNYSKSYIKTIEKLFGNKLIKEEVYRILFGVEHDLKDFHKLPLSKFKSDILKDLDII